VALEVRSSELSSEVADERSLKIAASVTLADSRAKRAVVSENSLSSRHSESVETHRSDFSESVTEWRRDVANHLDILKDKLLANVKEANEVDSQRGRSKSADEDVQRPDALKALSLPPASTGHVWIIRESSDHRIAPVLSEYVPKPGDTYVEQPGKAWKLVAGSSKADSLVVVVELVTTDQLAQESESYKQQKESDATAGLPSNPRQIERPLSFTQEIALEESVEKPSNATGPAYLESVGDSPFFLQQVMPVVMLFRNVPVWCGRRLRGIAAVVANIGLFTAQMLTLVIMTTILLLFLAIDKGYECCKREGQRKAEVNERDAWWHQLTSWDSMPGVEMGGLQSNFHFGCVNECVTRVTRGRQ
jgi:hypothetical protein